MSDQSQPGRRRSPFCEARPFCSSCIHARSASGAMTINARGCRSRRLATREWGVAPPLAAQTRLRAIYSRAGRSALGRFARSPRADSIESRVSQDFVERDLSEPN